MDAALDRIMSAYGMLRKLTPVEQRAVRNEVLHHLRKLGFADDGRMVVEGLRYLRGRKPPPDEKLEQPSD